MLDAVTNGESFEDFAIDSDDDNLQDLDLDDSLNEKSDAGDKTNGDVAAQAPRSDVAQSGGTNSDTYNTKTAGTALEHPLQMMGVGGADPLSQVNPAGTVNASVDSNLAGSQSMGGGVVVAAAAASLSNAGGEQKKLPSGILYC